MYFSFSRVKREYFSAVGLHMRHLPTRKEWRMANAIAISMKNERCIGYYELVTWNNRKNIFSISLAGTVVL
jgi:hypothetical protein